MSNQEIANKLKEYLQSGQYEQAHQELYAENAKSIEPQGAQNEVVEGLPGIQQKGKEFQAMVESVISNEVSEPIVAENFITFGLKMEMQFKGAPQPTVMEEVAVYEVQNGKIVKEQFFYTPQNYQG